MSHSAENPYCLPSNITEAFPYLYTLSTSLYIDNHSAPYLYTLSQVVRIEHDNTTRVVNQSESSTTPVGKHSETNPSKFRGGGPFSALGSSRTAIAYVKTWRVLHPPPDLLTILLLFRVVSVKTAPCSRFTS